MPEGEEKEQEIGNLLEKIMKENFPNWVKEIDMQVQESQRVPNKMDPERTTPIYIINKIPKVALAGVAQWIEHQPANQRVTGSIPSEGTCLVVDQVPGGGYARGNHTLIFLFFFLPSFPSL